MKEKLRYQIKDKVLQTLACKDLNISTISKLSEHLSIKYSIIHTLAMELKNENYIDGRAISSISLEAINDFTLQLLPKGEFIIYHDGGFESIFRKKRMEKAWLIIKIVAATLNSLAILYLSWRAIF